MTEQASKPEQSPIIESNKADDGKADAISDFVAGLIPTKSANGDTQQGQSDAESVPGGKKDEIYKVPQLPSIIIDEGKSAKDDPYHGGTPFVPVIPKDGPYKEIIKLYKPNDQTIAANEKGVVELVTGDKLVRVGNNEILIMPNGGSIQLKADGSIDVNAKNMTGMKYDAESGVTTIQTADGETIKIKNGKFLSVDKGEKSVKFAAAVVDDKELMDQLRKLLLPKVEPKLGDPLDYPKFYQGGTLLDSNEATKK